MEDMNNIFDKILTRSLRAPGARLNRAEFLYGILRRYLTGEQVEKAITTSVKNAEIPDSLLDRIAEDVIRNQTFKVTGISTLSGLPGGFALVATIPADLAQFYYHVIVLAQKLAFLYGYPQVDGNDEEDDELVNRLTMFIGVMYDVDQAREAVVNASQRSGAESLMEVPGVTVTETASYVLKKNIARWVGIKITEKSLSQGVSKVIPVVSGFVSGGISYTTFKPMAEKLKAALKAGYERPKP